MIINLSIARTVFLFVSGWMMVGCAASDDPSVNAENQVSSNYDTHTNIYDTLTLEGKFTSTIAQYKLVLKNDADQTFDFDLIEPSASHIKIFIPKDFAAAKYAVLLKKGSTLTTLADPFSEPVEVYVRKRPVILSSSSLSFKAGASIVLKGENFLNTSGVATYDPAVWIMAVGYTNSVNIVTVNNTGTEANVSISSSLNPGKYKLYIISGNGLQDSYEAWSNALYITITP